MQYKQDPNKALENYMKAFSLGGAKTLPELYEAADLEFNLSPEYIRQLAVFVNSELLQLLN